MADFGPVWESILQQVELSKKKIQFTLQVTNPWSLLAFLSWKTMSGRKVDSTIFSTSPDTVSRMLSLVAALRKWQYMFHERWRGDESLLLYLIPLLIINYIIHSWGLKWYNRIKLNVYPPVVSNHKLCNAQCKMKEQVKSDRAWNALWACNFRKERWALE